jgi:SAM-dependent methyltransferase
MNNKKYNLEYDCDNCNTEMYDCEICMQVDMALRDSPVIIDLGCGERYVPGTIGLDIDPMQAEYIPIPCDIRYANLKEGIPFNDQVVDQIISSHFIRYLGDHKDHLLNIAIPTIMKEIDRVMKPGGLITIRDYPDVYCWELEETFDLDPKVIRQAYEDAIDDEGLEIDIETFAVDTTTDLHEYVIIMRKRGAH